MSNFIHPCKGAKLSSPFGNRKIDGKQEWHQGIDLAQTGTVPILASAAGTVIRAGVLGTYGNVVIIQHTINGKRMDTTYAHLKSVNVKKSDKVKQGQQIGLMGNTGRSYGQHLHFEIHNGPWLTGQPNAINPWPYISGQMLISKAGLDLIKKWEGFYSKAYLCPSKIWTIGYGTTKYANGKPVKQGDTITQTEALKLLEIQVNEHASTISSYVKVPLSQVQYDALASFQYNLGRHILKNSALLRYLNNKQFKQAANEMLLYNKARVGGVLTELRGLTDRRKEEVTLFLKEAEDEMDFNTKGFEEMYNTRKDSKATETLLINTATKMLNLNPTLKDGKLSEGDKALLAYEVAVYYMKLNK